MNKIIVLKGLPGAGKTTWAKEQCSKGWKRVSKDDLRAMFDNSIWTKANEELILELRDKLIQVCLIAGKNVIVDDTNFEPKHLAQIKHLADVHNTFAHDNDSYCVEEKFFDTDVEECVKRNAKRQNPVPEKVIRDMHARYLKPAGPVYTPNPSLPDAIICDLDGTLCLLNGRDPYDPKTVLDDEINPMVDKVLEALLRMDGFELIFVSGRFEKYRKQTCEWLAKHDYEQFILEMRKDGDNRKDAIIKKEIFDELKKSFNISLVLDDRNQVVEMWRDQGLTVFQVAEGKF